ncbi:MAG TPA: hypothetical protein VE981_02015 [Planctomycetota bacterium]|nr:hypothetical protein [Planctomycetota bacterium]
MIPALLLLAVLQGEAPVDQDKERLRSKPPLTEARKAGYVLPAVPAAKPRAAYTLVLVPVEFADRKFASADVPKTLFASVGEYYARASGGRFQLSGEIAGRVALDRDRAAFERKDLEKIAGRAPAGDGIAFIVAGGMVGRGAPLWPHRGVVRSGDRELDYVLVPEEAAPAILAHEFMHLLGFADKYDDEKAAVADACILGTGYSVKRPPPPCAECRLQLGWASAAEIDPATPTSVVMEPDLYKVVRIKVTPDGDEALLLEMRERLLVWHIGGGRKIELIGRFPTDATDRLTPLSEPSFRGRSVGARPVCLTDIRIQDGKAWFQISLDAPMTPLEEWRRSRIGKRLGD